MAVGLGVLLAWLVTPPRPAAWPWLVASVCVHVVYNLGLIAAYQVGDFNQAYPLARGLGPLLVAVSPPLLSEPLPMLGVLLIAGEIGVLGLTPWRRVRHNRPTLLAAVLTGLTIAGYTLLDGVGVRCSSSPIGYAVWLPALHGAVTVSVVALVCRSRWAPPNHGTRLDGRPPLPVGYQNSVMVSELGVCAATASSSDASRLLSNGPACDQLSRRRVVSAEPEDALGRPIFATDIEGREPHGLGVSGRCGR